MRPPRDKMSNIGFHGDIDESYAIFLENINKITTRGPGLHGDETFDKACIFGNYVEMNYNQVTQLKDMVKKYPRPVIKEYVYMMTKSSVIPKKCKMEFSKDFTKDYLLGYLSAPIKVVVNCKISNKAMYVLLNMGKSGKAMITSGLTSTVEELNMKEWNICSFSFRDERGYSLRDENAWLKLVITKLEK